MKSIPILRSALVALLASAGAPAGHAADTEIIVPDPQIITPNAMKSAVTVKIDRVDGAVISGRVINKTGHSIKDPELALRYHWLWWNDRAPGNNDPSWVTFHVIPREIGAEQSAEFTFDPGWPLPKRNDGYIVPWASVVEVTKIQYACSTAGPPSNRHDDECYRSGQPITR